MSEQQSKKHTSVLNREITHHNPVEQLWTDMVQLLHEVEGGRISAADANMALLPSFIAANEERARHVRIIRSVDNYFQTLWKLCYRGKQRPKLPLEREEAFTEVKLKVWHAVTQNLLDPLTKVFSRHVLLQELQEVLNDLALGKITNKVAITLFDLDGFKNANDMVSHKFGDAVLNKIAQILRNRLSLQRISTRRVIDVVQLGRDKSRLKRDLIGRFGGDEFVAVMEINKSDYNIQERLIKVQIMLHEEISSFILSARDRQKAQGLSAVTEDGYDVRRLTNDQLEILTAKLGFSFGTIVLETGAKHSIDEVLSEADRLMYENKKSRKAGR